MPLSSYIKGIRDKIGHDLLLIPSVTAIILNARGEVLLQKASDDGKWHSIGGGIEPNEQPKEAVIREVLEETGLVVEVQSLLDVVTHPPTAYSNGDRCQYVAAVFHCNVIGGELRINDDESLAFEYFDFEHMPTLPEVELAVIKNALQAVSKK